MRPGKATIDPAAMAGGTMANAQTAPLMGGPIRSDSPRKAIIGDVIIVTRKAPATNVKRHILNSSERSNEK